MWFYGFPVRIRLSWYSPRFEEDHFFCTANLDLYISPISRSSRNDKMTAYGRSNFTLHLQQLGFPFCCGFGEVAGMTYIAFNHEVVPVLGISNRSTVTGGRCRCSTSGMLDEASIDVITFGPKSIKVRCPQWQCTRKTCRWGVATILLTKSRLFGMANSFSRLSTYHSNIMPWEDAKFSSRCRGWILDSWWVDRFTIGFLSQSWTSQKTTRAKCKAKFASYSAFVNGLAFSPRCKISDLSASEVSAEDLEVGNIRDSKISSCDLCTTSSSWTEMIPVIVVSMLFNSKEHKKSFRQVIMQLWNSPGQSLDIPRPEVLTQLRTGKTCKHPDKPLLNRWIFLALS